MHAWGFSNLWFLTQRNWSRVSLSESLLYIKKCNHFPTALFTTSTPSALLANSLKEGQGPRIVVGELPRSDFSTGSRHLSERRADEQRLVRVSGASFRDDKGKGGDLINYVFLSAALDTQLAI